MGLRVCQSGIDWPALLNAPYRVESERVAGMEFTQLGAKKVVNKGVVQILNVRAVQRAKLSGDKRSARASYICFPFALAGFSASADRNLDRVRFPSRPSVNPRLGAPSSQWQPQESVGTCRYFTCSLLARALSRRVQTPCPGLPFGSW